MVRSSNLTLFLVLSALLAPVISNAQATPVRRVLIFYELGLSSPAVAVVDQELREGLAKTPYQIELYHEYFETALFPDPVLQQEFRDWYIRKYRDHRPDLIIALGPSPLKFLVESHEKFFDDIPIVFGDAAKEEVDNPKLDAHFRGVWERFEPEKTLEGALRLQPDTQHVVVVGGMSQFDRRLEALFKERLHSYETKLDFKYLTDLDMPGLLGQLKHLPPHTVVLYTHLGLDAKGTQFLGLSQASTAITAAAGAPVFSVSDLDLGHGEVGGYLENLPAEGRIVGEIAARLLNGEKPQDISTVSAAHAYTFDWRALQRWGLNESRLPPGSIVLNRQATFWEAYRQYVISGILLFLAQTTIIVALVLQWRKKKKAQNALLIAKERLRLAMETAKAVSWDVDLKKGQTTWFGGLQNIVGDSSDKFSTTVGNLSDHVHPEDRQRISQAFQLSRERHEPFAAEFRLVGSEGEARWVSAKGKFDYLSNGDATHMLGMAVDITERKLTQEALQKSEEKFSKAFRESPIALTLTSVHDHRYIEVNETFEHATGWNREEVIGRNPDKIDIWVDLERRGQYIERLLADGSVRNFEVSFRTKNGPVRTGLGSGELIEISGEQCALSAIVDITDLKRAQEKMRESQDRLEGIVASAMDAIIAVDSEQRIVVFNAAAEVMFGCPAQDALLAPIERFIPYRFRSAHRQHIHHFGQSSHTTRAMGVLDALFGLRSNGEEFPIEASISQVNTDEGKLYTVIIRDVTQRKKAEDAARESEERFRLVANTAPVMIWMSGLDKLCDYCNRPWLAFTGRPLEAELGNGWAEGIHSEDRERCWNTYTTSFDRREAFEMEYRLRRYDGEYRWITDLGVPRFNADGSFAGYIGSCLDVTERKLAEEALSTVSRRLIEAHEEERTRLARELHDDINQRLALVAVTLDVVRRDLPLDAAEARRSIGEIKDQLTDLGNDIQALSHRLHSSKIDYLGLVSAVGAFCREFSERQGVQVDFEDEAVPKTLPKEISLCLFRVLQEALQNVTKHSGSRQAHVSLIGTSDRIQLNVRDEGIGFDSEDELKGHGLGIVSMRERLKLVNGDFHIGSWSQKGTEVRASIPLIPLSKSASAGKT